MATPSEALHRENWLNEGKRIFGHNFFSSLQAFFDQRLEKKQSDGSGGYANLNLNDVARAEQIDLSEVVDRPFAGRWQAKDDNEAALIQFIKLECPDIDSALQPYLSAA